MPILIRFSNRLNNRLFAPPLAQEKEHVLFRAKSHCSVGRFLLADSTYTDDAHVSNKVRHTYWFPDKDVNAGDYVSLWTKNGTSTSGTIKDGTPIHRFFWNLGKPVWNDSGDCAILFDLQTWQFFQSMENKLLDVTCRQYLRVQQLDRVSQFKGENDGEKPNNLLNLPECP